MKRLLLGICAWCAALLTAGEIVYDKGTPPFNTAGMETLTVEAPNASTLKVEWVNFDRSEKRTAACYPSSGKTLQIPIPVWAARARIFAGTVASGTAGKVRYSLKKRVYPAIPRSAGVILRIGICTDTHVWKSELSHMTAKAAFCFFARQNLDLFVNCGDVADRFNADVYRKYRTMLDEAFQEQEVPEIHLYAYHDSIDNHAKWMTEFPAALKIQNKPWEVREMKGVPIGIVPQSCKEKEYADFVDGLAKKYKGKPILLFDHVPAYDTVYDSCVWGDHNRRKILSRYPDVIQITGHVHGSLRNELLIWQKEFTAVNAGCLQVWQGAWAGSVPKSRYSDGVLLLDLYRDKAVFRRFSVQTGREYRPENPWTVPLPFRPETAPYNPDRRTYVIPEFPEGAEITSSADGKSFRNLTFQFTPAQGKDGVFRYRITLERKDSSGKWVTYARRDMPGSFFRKEPPKRESAVFSAGYVDDNVPFRVVVTPENFAGKAGKPLVREFCLSGKAKGKIVYDCRNPMKELKFYPGLRGGKPLPVVKEFFEHKTWNGRLELPPEIWAKPEKADFRFIVEMRTIQNGDPWTMVLRNPEPLINANERIKTPGGDTGTLRYVIDFKRRRDLRFYLLIREGGGGKIRFERITLERF